MIDKKQEKAYYALIAEYLQEISPEMHKTCVEVVKPLLNDHNHVKEIFNYILVNQGYVFCTENAHFYLAVFYRIYSPIHLYTKKCRLRNGLRERIRNVFNYNAVEMINYLADSVLPYYKNPRWATQINELAFDIVENIKIELAECQ